MDGELRPWSWRVLWEANFAQFLYNSPSSECQFAALQQNAPQLRLTGGGAVRAGVGAAAMRRHFPPLPHTTPPTQPSLAAPPARPASACHHIVSSTLCT